MTMKKILFAVALAGVGCDSEVEPEVDAEPVQVDASKSDAGASDAGASDARLPDASAPDAAICGAVGEACCAGETCNDGLECNFNGGFVACTPPCGGEGERCCEDTRPSGCDDGFACKIDAQGGEICVTACFGDHPGYCPSGEDCMFAVDADKYLCVECGDVGQPCCDGTCNPGAVCSGMCVGAP